LAGEHGNDVHLAVRVDLLEALLAGELGPVINVNTDDGQVATKQRRGHVEGVIR
jgi:hypothetical protein